MQAQEWNDRYPIGSAVVVRLANGHALRTTTIARAQCWGGLNHIQVEGLSGFVLLSWVSPDDLQPGRAICNE